MVEQLSAGQTVEQSGGPAVEQLSSQAVKQLSGQTVEQSNSQAVMQSSSRVATLTALSGITIICEQCVGDGNSVTGHKTPNQHCLQLWMQMLLEQYPYDIW